MGRSNPNAALETSPMLDVPDSLSGTGAQALGGTVVVAGLSAATTTSTSFVDLLNVTGQGVLEFAAVQTINAVAFDATLEVIIDGVSVSCTTGASQYSMCCPVGAAWYTGVALAAVPFKQSLVIRHKVASATQTSRGTFKWRRTAS